MRWGGPLHSFLGEQIKHIQMEWEIGGSMKPTMKYMSDMGEREKDAEMLSQYPYNRVWEIIYQKLIWSLRSFIS